CDDVGHPRPVEPLVGGLQGEVVTEAGEEAIDGELLGGAGIRGPRESRGTRTVGEVLVRDREQRVADVVARRGTGQAVVAGRRPDQRDGPGGPLGVSCRRPEAEHEHPCQYRPEPVQAHYSSIATWRSSTPVHPGDRDLNEVVDTWEPNAGFPSRPSLARQQRSSIACGRDSVVTASGDRQAGPG